MSEELDCELNLIGSILNEDDVPSRVISNFQSCADNLKVSSLADLSEGQKTPNTNTNFHHRSIDNMSDMPTHSMLAFSMDSVRYWQGSIDGDFSPKPNLDFDRDQYDVTPCRNKRKNGPAIQHHYMSERSLPNLGQMQQRQFQFKQDNIYQNQWGMDEISEDIQLSNDMDALCGNQMMSRKIQKLFEFGKPSQRDIIFSKIERSYLQYAKDIFGNYVVQKVIEKGTVQQKMKMFNKLRQHFYDLSKHNFGCRVIQKILEVVQTDPPLQEKFLDQIRMQVKSLLYDVYGNYVILKCLDTVPKDRLSFILPPILDSISYMVQQTYGCRILQKIMETYTQDEVSKITKATIQQCHILCQSEYGNYIIQHVIKNGPVAEQEILSILIKQNFYVLSLNKYGSNTVEKYIESADRESLKEITILLMKGQQEPFFVTLSVHPFGNYVFKKFLVMADAVLLEPVLNVIRQAPMVVARIRASEYGSRVFSVLEKIMCSL